jgi:nucleotide-binding universal stress UspA family protein
MTEVDAQGVVVGVDGSASSAEALGFGMREAARRGSALKVITAWMPDGATGGGARRQAQQVQDDAVATALRRNPGARPLLSRLVVSGEAGAILLRAAESAAYLVLGSSVARAPSGELGPVGAYCVSHATVPVVVVPGAAPGH